MNARDAQLLIEELLKEGWRYEDGTLKSPRDSMWIDPTSWAFDELLETMNRRIDTLGRRYKLIPSVEDSLEDTRSALRACQAAIERVDTHCANPYSQGDLPTLHAHPGGRVRSATPDESPQ